MFRVGEFSKLGQVTIRMLRYYDETGLLKPAQTDPVTGYRLYSVEQLPILNKIIYLRDSGFNVAEIAAALRDGNTPVVEHLDRKYREIEKSIEREKGKLEKIELARKELRENRSQHHFSILMKSIPAYPVLSVRRRIPDYYGEGRLWNELSAFASRAGIPLSGDAFSIYHDEDYREEDVDVEVCGRVTSMGQSEGEFLFRCTEPEPLMACFMVYGEFKNIAGAYLSAARWLAENSQYQMAGKSRQIVHRGPWNEEDSGKYLTEIQIALRR